LARDYREGRAAWQSARRGAKFSIPRNLDIPFTAIDHNTAMPYMCFMFTVIETPTFVRLADDCWNDEDRTDFITFIASNPEVGDVVPGSGGLRKVRWGRAGRGKRGGARVIYFNRLANGEIWLLLVYAKAVRENISAQLLRRIKEEIENA